MGKNVSFSLFKVRPTPPQVTLKKVERERNLKGAFYFNGELRGMRVLLVDDVLTTGTTLEECSGALLKAGALKIVKLVIAVSL
ncbi:MAG: ComF family protein [Clostridia bacterium]|nr:ComF family protein [Clostridia bacterium]